MRDPNATATPERRGLRSWRIPAFVAVVVVWPQMPGNYIPGGDALPGSQGIHLGPFNRQGAKLGLDLQGGPECRAGEKPVGRQMRVPGLRQFG